MPSAQGARVRLSGGTFRVTDGPFTETKELIAGFALIQAKSKEEAVEYSKQFLNLAGDGETENQREQGFRHDVLPETSEACSAARRHHRGGAVPGA